MPVAELARLRVLVQELVQMQAQRLVQALELQLEREPPLVRVQELPLVWVLEPPLVRVPELELVQMQGREPARQP